MPHAIGTFCCAELHTPDVEASARFYGDLFGWELKPPVIRHTSGPARWIPFVRVERLEAAAERARGLGVRDVSTPFVTGAARTCIVEDHGGAVFGLREDDGGEASSPGMWWVETSVDDIAAAHRFYSSLFGWRPETTKKYHDADGHLEYTVFRIGDDGVAGAIQHEPSWGVTQRWQIIFAIDDWKKTITGATHAGCRLEFWRDVPNVGRLGNLWDPTGALFCVMRERQAE